MPTAARRSRRAGRGCPTSCCSTSAWATRWTADSRSAGNCARCRRPADHLSYRARQRFRHGVGPAHGRRRLRHQEREPAAPARARQRAVPPRGAGAAIRHRAKTSFERGPLTLDLNRFTVSWRGQDVDLTLTEFWMVHALAKFPGPRQESRPVDERRAHRGRRQHHHFARQADPPQIQRGRSRISTASTPCTAWATGGGPIRRIEPELRPACRRSCLASRQARAGGAGAAGHTLGRLPVRADDGAPAAREPGAAVDRHRARRRDRAAGPSAAARWRAPAQRRRHRGATAGYRAGAAADRRPRRGPGSRIWVVDKQALARGRRGQPRRRPPPAAAGQRHLRPAGARRARGAAPLFERLHEGPRRRPRNSFPTTSSSAGARSSARSTARRRGAAARRRTARAVILSVGAPGVGRRIRGRRRRGRGKHRRHRLAAQPRARAARRGHADRVRGRGAGAVLLRVAPVIAPAAAARRGGERDRFAGPRARRWSPASTPATRSATCRAASRPCSSGSRSTTTTSRTWRAGLRTSCARRSPWCARRSTTCGCSSSRASSASTSTRAEEGLNRLETILTRMSEATRLEQVVRSGERERFDASERAWPAASKAMPRRIPRRRFALTMTDRAGAVDRRARPVRPDARQARRQRRRFRDRRSTD